MLFTYSAMPSARLLRLTSFVRLGRRLDVQRTVYTMEQQPLILDPCCGSRMMWFDRGHKDVVFGDRRSETLTVTDRSHKEDGTRTLVIEPDALMDFRALPYPDETFYLVAFDPPHLVRAGPRSWLAAKYGKLGKDWREYRDAQRLN